MVLLTFTNIEARNLLSRPINWMSKWFESSSLWDPSIVNTERFVWLKAFGIPLHIWNPNFFRSLSCSFRSFVYLDRPTETKERLDVGWFLICTTDCNFISRTIIVLINGEQYNTFVIEDPLSWISSPSMTLNKATNTQLAHLPHHTKAPHKPPGRSFLTENPHPYLQVQTPLKMMMTRSMSSILMMTWLKTSSQMLRKDIKKY